MIVKSAHLKRKWDQLVRIISKSYEGILATFFIIFVMVIIVVQSPFDGYLKLHQNILISVYKLNGRLEPILHEFLSNSDDVLNDKHPVNKVYINLIE